MTDSRITRRSFVVAGGAASLLVVAPNALRTVAVRAATASSPASVGFVDTIAPLSAGARVKPLDKVRGDATLVNRPLEIVVSGVYPATDAAFPAATLDTVFPQSGAAFYAFTHAGGLARARSVFTMTPTSSGLQFTLGTGGTSRTAALGMGSASGLRTGTYLFGLGGRTWSSGGTLNGQTSQRSVVVVIRPA